MFDSVFDHTKIKSFIHAFIHSLYVQRYHRDCVAAIRTYVSANFIVKHLLYLIWIVTFMQYNVTLLHITVHFKPYYFQGCIPL